DTLDKNSGQIIWTLGLPAPIRKKAYELDQLRTGFISREGGLTAAEWELLLTKKAQLEAGLKNIAVKEPSRIWVEDLCTRKPDFSEQFDELYDQWKNAKTAKEKTDAWRLANRLQLDVERKILEYNGRNEAIKAANRLHYQIMNSSFDKAVELTPQCAQLLQDQYYMIPLYMEKYQYVLRSNISGMNIYKFAWGPTVFNLKYLNIK
ncbi:MAG TPA: peptide ABC transporter substrate-binding protein, partial [Bacillota bacterium]|nr:peptide ABC transporter substrate-binding protein [Bacillota bacterium]